MLQEILKERVTNERKNVIRHPLRWCHKRNTCSNCYYELPFLFSNKNSNKTKEKKGQRKAKNSIIQDDSKNSNCEAMVLFHES